MIQIDAVDGAEVNRLAADDCGRWGEVSAGSGIVITIEDEGHGLAGASEGERVGMSRQAAEGEGGCYSKQRKLRKKRHATPKWRNWICGSVPCLKAIVGPIALSGNCD